MPYTWCQEPWELLAGRGIYWPRHQALLVADLLLGKELVFRKSGLAIPEGATQETLERLDRLLEATSARNLWILGDLFHARSGLSEQLEQWLVAWRQRHEAITIELVAGNHDRGTRTAIAGGKTKFRQGREISLRSKCPLLQVTCIRRLRYQKFLGSPDRGPVSSSAPME